MIFENEDGHSFAVLESDADFVALQAHVSRHDNGPCRGDWLPDYTRPTAYPVLVCAELLGDGEYRLIDVPFKAAAAFLATVAERELAAFKKFATKEKQE